MLGKCFFGLWNWIAGLTSPYALLAYNFFCFSIEETVRILELDVEHWRFASHSSTACLWASSCVKFSGALPFLSVWNLLLPSRLMPSFLEEEFLGAAGGRAVFQRPERCPAVWTRCWTGSALPCSVDASDWDWICFSVKSPNSKLDLQNWQRVPELSQFPPELDIVLFLMSNFIAQELKNSEFSSRGLILF